MNSSCKLKRDVSRDNHKMATHPDLCKRMCVFVFADFLNKFHINILKERFYLFSTF